MKRFDASLAYLACAAALVACAFVHARDERARSTSRVADAARAFLATLDAKQKERATFPFASDERMNWHFVPRERKGVALGDLDDAQKLAAHALLASALSERGHLRVKGVIELETVLRGVEGAWRDPGRYFVTVFGAPGEREWGWRFEGHHVALNVTAIDGELVAETPFFLGANPARVASGPSAGTRVLGAVEDAAHALVASLDAEERKLATLPGDVPGDVILGPGREASFAQRLGLPFERMTSEQRALGETLLHQVLDDLEGGATGAVGASGSARAAWERATKDGLGAVRFAWSGGTNEGEPHYWRLHGATLAIELDDVQGGANHVHLLVRDLANDFGADALREHRLRDHGDPSKR